jgi:hypothetical protein
MTMIQAQRTENHKQGSGDGNDPQNDENQVNSRNNFNHQRQSDIHISAAITTLAVSVLGGDSGIGITQTTSPPQARDTDTTVAPDNATATTTTTAAMESCGVNSNHSITCSNTNGNSKNSIKTEATCSELEVLTKARTLIRQHRVKMKHMLNDGRHTHNDGEEQEHGYGHDQEDGSYYACGRHAQGVGSATTAPPTATAKYDNHIRRHPHPKDPTAADPTADSTADFTATSTSTTLTTDQAQAQAADTSTASANINTNTTSISEGPKQQEQETLTALTSITANTTATAGINQQVAALSPASQNWHKMPLVVSNSKADTLGEIQEEMTLMQQIVQECCHENELLFEEGGVLVDENDNLADQVEVLKRTLVLAEQATYKLKKNMETLEYDLEEAHAIAYEEAWFDFNSTKYGQPPSQSHSQHHGEADLNFNAPLKKSYHSTGSIQSRSQSLNGVGGLNSTMKGVGEKCARSVSIAMQMAKHTSNNNKGSQENLQGLTSSTSRGLGSVVKNISRRRIQPSSMEHHHHHHHHHHADGTDHAEPGEPSSGGSISGVAGLFAGSAGNHNGAGNHSNNSNSRRRRHSAAKALETRDWTREDFKMAYEVYVDDLAKKHRELDRERRNSLNVYKKQQAAVEALEDVTYLTVEEKKALKDTQKKMEKIIKSCTGANGCKQAYTSMLQQQQLEEQERKNTLLLKQVQETACAKEKAAEQALRHRQQQQLLNSSSAAAALRQQQSRGSASGTHNSNDLYCGMISQHSGHGGIMGGGKRGSGRTVAGMLHLNLLGGGSDHGRPTSNNNTNGLGSSSASAAVHNRHLNSGEPASAKGGGDALATGALRMRAKRICMAEIVLPKDPDPTAAELLDADADAGDGSDDADEEQTSRKKKQNKKASTQRSTSKNSGLSLEILQQLQEGVGAGDKKDSTSNSKRSSGPRDGLSLDLLQQLQDAHADADDDRTDEDEGHDDCNNEDDQASVSPKAVTQLFGAALVLGQEPAATEVAVPTPPPPQLLLSQEGVYSVLDSIKATTDAFSTDWLLRADAHAPDPVSPLKKEVMASSACGASQSSLLTDHDDHGHDDNDTHTHNDDHHEQGDNHADEDASAMTTEDYSVVTSQSTRRKRHGILPYHPLLLGGLRHRLALEKDRRVSASGVPLSDLHQKVLLSSADSRTANTAADGDGHGQESVAEDGDADANGDGDGDDGRNSVISILSGLTSSCPSVGGGSPEGRNHNTTNNNNKNSRGPFRGRRGRRNSDTNSNDSILEISSEESRKVIATKGPDMNINVDVNRNAFGGPSTSLGCRGGRKNSSVLGNLLRGAQRNQKVQQKQLSVDQHNTRGTQPHHATPHHASNISIL